MSHLLKYAEPTESRITTVLPAIAEIRNPLQPEVTNHKFLKVGTTVAEALEGFDLTTYPVLTTLNSEPILEEDWGTELQMGDVITLVREPQAFAIPAVVAWTLTAITAVVTAYSIYTILTLDLPDPGQRGDSNNYTISYLGNRRKPGATMPVVYGTIRTYPDYSGMYTLYIDQDQWLYQIFDVTLGEIEPIVDAEVWYEDTNLTSFSEYEIETVPPGSTSTIFPSNVILSSEVDKIELINANEWTPAYRVAPVGTNITSIIYNVVAPHGTFNVSDKGSYNLLTTFFVVQWRQVGAGSWQEEQHVMPFTRGVPHRMSINITVAPGEYEVRVARANQKSNKTDKVNDLIWESVYGTEEDVTVTETTRFAIKIRSSNTLGNQSLSKLNLLAKRKIRTWSSSWGAETQTNLAAWAFADACSSAYGGNLADEYIDLEHLSTLAGEGYEFNAIFDTEMTLWDVLNEIARPMLGRAVQKPGGIYSITVDREGVVPVAMYTMRSIIKGSFSVQHNLPVDELTNFVRVTFKDAAQNYHESTIDCVPYGVTQNQPYEIRLRGVTDYDTAYEIGLRMANESRYRRKRITFKAGLHGFIPTYGDTIRIGHYQLGLEQTVQSFSGEIKSGSGTFTVFEDLSEIQGTGGLQAFIMDSDGTPSGPHGASVTGPHTMTVSGAPNITYGDDHQGPHYCIGSGDVFMVQGKVTRVQQIGEHEVQIEAVEDTPNAYIGDQPPTSSPIPPPQDAAPVVSNLYVELFGTGEDMNVRMLWDSQYCDYHIVDMSEDNRTTWAEQGRPTGNTLSFPVPYMDGLIVRVRGVNLFVGNAIEAIVDVISGNVSYPGVYGLRPRFPFNGDICSVEWDKLAVGSYAVLKFITNGTVIRQDTIDHTTTWAEITRQEVMSVQSSAVYGTIFPAVGCRTITVRMHGARYIDGVLTEDTVFQELIMKNDPMGALKDIVYRVIGKDINIAFAWPEADGGYVYVYQDIVPGFVPAPEKLVFFGDTNNITIPQVLQYETQYYFKLAGFDHWGPDDLVYTELDINTDPASEFEMPPIEDYHLHSDLSSRIDLIDVTDGGGLVAKNSAVQSQADANTGQISVVASDLTQVATEVDGNTAAIQTQATSIDGLEAKYTVKVDVNGHVAGYGLAAYPNDDGFITSEFLCLVDKFGIASPGATHLTFEVEGDLVKMDGARIKSASILNASIAGVIASNNYIPTQGIGWMIDKDGGSTFGDITIYDRTGDIVLQTGVDTPIYAENIDNTRQNWADISSIPNHLELAVINKFSMALYGDLWIDWDNPSSGKVRIQGESLYNSNGSKQVFVDGGTLDCFARDPNIIDVGLIIYSPTELASRFAGWQYGSNTARYFCVAEADQNGNIEAIDGNGNRYTFNPNRNDGLMATWSRPSWVGSGDSFGTGTLLIGVNTFLPRDGATMNGNVNLIMDGSFSGLKWQDLSFTNSNWWYISGDVTAGENSTEGVTVRIGSGGTLQQLERVPVTGGDVLYAAFNYYAQSSWNNGTVLNLAVYDGNGNALNYPTVVNVYPGNGQTNTWAHASGAVKLHDDAVEVSPYIYNKSTSGSWTKIGQFTLTRGPTEISYATAPTFIRDLAVDTLQIADNAITVPQYATTGAVDAPNTTYVNCAQIQFTPSKAGAPVLLSWSAEAQLWNGGNHWLRIMRNFTKIFPVDTAAVRSFYVSGAQSDEVYGGLSGSYIDTGHGGVEVTYTVQIAGNSTDGFHIARSLLTATEAKK